MGREYAWRSNSKGGTPLSDEESAMPVMTPATGPTLYETVSHGYEGKNTMTMD